MSWMTRGPGAVMAASLLALAGCGDDEWDGSFTPLEELGDWQDTGPYASCKPLPEAANACNPSLEAFDLSSCPRATLNGLEREGIYRAALRYELSGDDGIGTYIDSGAGSFRFGPDGAPMSVHGLPVSGALVAPETFITTGRQTNANGETTFTYTLAGCEAPSARVLRGCFITCFQGRPRYVGTFHAERMAWGRSEPESSGGLKPVSESAVELGSPVDVYVAKNHAYVVSINRYGELGGLTVFDVKDRAHPIFKTSISLPGDSYWNGVWAKGDALYIASANTGVIVYDISNPGQPTFLRSLPGGAPIDVHTVLVDGDRLYAMSPKPNKETLIFDVSTPLEPVLLGRSALGAFDIHGYPHDAFAFGGRLYVSHTQGGYQVLDASDPANVQRLGGYRFPGNYSHHSAVGTFAGQTIAFEGGEHLGAHLRVLKVDAPANIVKIGEFKLRDVTSIHNMILKGTRLYIAWYHEGVRVLDVSNPTQPRQVAHFNTFRDTDPNSHEGLYEGALGIRVPDDGYVYVADDVRGLLIFKEP